MEQASLSVTVKRGDTNLIALKEGQGRLREVMERRFNRFEDILRGQ